MGTLVIARLKPGASFEQASAEMGAMANRLAAEYPRSNSGSGARVDRYNDVRTEDYRQTLYLLLGAVGLVLLIACANVANLLLARAVTRQRATAIQAALGAGRGRIVRQSLAESLVLAAVGGVVGLGLGFLALHFLGGILPENLPRRDEIELNWAVLGYTFGVACLTGLIFGIIPALETSRVNLGEILKQAGATAGTFSARRRFGRGFLVAETAVATILLIGAGLLIRTIHELMQVDPGFHNSRLLKMDMLLGGKSDAGRNLRFFREVEGRLAALPGVESVGVSLSAPMMGVIWSSAFTAADQPVPPRDQLPSSILNTVDVSYFDTFGIPIVRGRSFTEADRTDAPPVVIINQTLARRIWGDQDPIGKRIKLGWPESEGENFPWREVVGVAADTKQVGLGVETDMETYLPFAQRALSYAKVTLRTAVDPRSLIEPAKRAVHRGRPHRAGSRDSHDGRDPGRFDGPAAGDDDPADGLRRAGAATGGGGHLWGDRLLGGAAHTGAWRADRDRRAAERRASPRAPAGHQAGARGSGDRRPGRHRPHAAAEEPAVRHQPARSTDIRARAGRPGPGSLAGMHYPGDPGDADSPVIGVAVRVRESNCSFPQSRAHWKDVAYLGCGREEEFAASTSFA